MITNFKFFCPHCKKQDYQKIIFLNHDFQFQCLHCEAFNIFHYQTLTINNSLYIGTFKDKWIVKNFNYCRTNNDYINTQKTLLYFEYLISKFNDNNNESTAGLVMTSKISEKRYQNQKIFIANASPNRHFQECIRGVIRMKEHLLESNSSNYYNILIKNEKTNLLCDPLSKLNGLDELWEIQSSHVGNHFDEKIDQKSIELSTELTCRLNQLDSQAQCVSKQAGPTMHGPKLIKDLFYLKNEKVLYLNYRNQKIKVDKKYIAVTVRSDNLNGRAGFDDPAEIHQICSLIRQRGFIPIVVACSKSEINICSKLQDVETLIMISLEDQVLFYSEYCYGMVGTNGSCCNIPSLFNIPMFILARDRQFPDDFYCFGRLISPYLENHPFHGELWKADNVWEYAVDMEEKTSIDKYKNEFYDWLYTLGKNILCEN